jgi:D-cysteine desulfhydrase
VRELPRFPLAALPTPLQRARRLEAELGSAPIWVKRDDLVGFALGGNKVRKLELLVADARQRGCDVLLTGGGPRSNLCQATAAAARVAGLGCRLVLYGSEPEVPPSNLRLARAFGAEVTFTGVPERTSVDRGLQGAARALRAEGREPALIPRGGATALGAVGYALAAAELGAQLEAEGIADAVVVVANGSSGTQAGLVAGAVERAWRIIGAVTSREPGESRRRVLQIATGCAELLGTAAPAPDAVEVRDARGPGYGRPSVDALEAAELAARTEGLLLDPVFTAKAMAALIEVVREGAEGPFVFVHTGGLPAVLDAASGAEEGGTQ